MEMPQVFISYAEEDEDFARRVSERLESFCTTYYRPVTPPTEPLSGYHIIECEVFLLIVSPNSLRSDRVDQEVLRARMLQRPFVLLVSEAVADAELRERRLEWWKADARFRVHFDMGPTNQIIHEIERRVGTRRPRFPSPALPEAGPPEAEQRRATSRESKAPR